MTTKELIFNHFPAGLVPQGIHKEKIMKKDYLKPEVYAVNLTGSSAILSASNDNTVPGGDGEVIPTAGKNRGEWGDVWGK